MFLYTLYLYHYMGQDIYTKVKSLQEEYKENKITINQTHVGKLLTHSILKVPKDHMLSYAKTYVDNGNDIDVSFDKLSEQASRLLKARHIKQIRKNILNYDTNSVYQLDSLSSWIKDLIVDFEDSHPQSLENKLYSLNQIQPVPFDEIGKKIMQGSQKYSKMASKEGQKGRDWALFKEYNAIIKELDKLK